MLKLICQSGTNAGQIIEITQTPFKIGRKAGNDLQILSPYVSKFHIEISRDAQGRYWVKDLNSKNGSTLNRESVQDVMELLPDSRLILGDNEVFIIDLSTGEVVENSTPVSRDNFLQPAGSVALARMTPVESAGSASNSWMKLIDVSLDLPQNFEFEDQPEPTSAMNPPASEWPEVVQLQREHQFYKQLVEIARSYLRIHEKHLFFKEVQQHLRSLFQFKQGIIVIYKEKTNPRSWFKYYLVEKNEELANVTEKIHYSRKDAGETQLLKFQNQSNRLLYAPFCTENQTFGFMALLAANGETTFIDLDRSKMALFKELVEATLLKFL